MTLNELIHKTLMAGIGVPEKIKEVIDELVKKGELSESQGAKLVREYSEKINKTGDELNRLVTDLIDNALEKINIPTRDELEKLSRKVSSLSSRVKKLEESAGRDSE
jgi:polyhydroxyalkanoate synthesis regulator phasin